MGKHKISNWKQYNQALVQRGSLTVWMDEQAIQQWHYYFLLDMSRDSRRVVDF